MCGGNVFRESDEDRREFFRNWSLVTGVEVPEYVLDGINYPCTC